MGALMCEDSAKHEPLLVYVSATGPQSHGGPLLRFVITAIVILFLISTSVLVLGALSHGWQEDQSWQNREIVLNGYLDVGVWLLRVGYGSESNNANWACFCEVVSGRFTSFHQKINELAHTHTIVQKVANYVAELVKFQSPMTLSFKQHQSVDAIVAPEKVEMPSSDAHISVLNSAVSNRVARGASRRSHSLRKAKLISFMKIAQDLSQEGLLHAHQRILCLDPSTGQKVRALKKRGYKNVEGIEISPARKNPLVETLADQSFDFAYTTVFDRISEPALFIAEIERILKVGGFAAMHVSLNAWRNKYIRSKLGDGAKPVTLLFKASKIAYVSTAYAPGLDTIIVFKKVSSTAHTRLGEKTKGGDQAVIGAKQPHGHALPSRPFVGPR